MKFSVAEVRCRATLGPRTRAPERSNWSLCRTRVQHRMPALNGRWCARHSAWHSAFSREHSRESSARHTSPSGEKSVLIKGLLQTALRTVAHRGSSSCSRAANSSIAQGRTRRLLFRVLGVLPIEAERGGCLPSEPLEVLLLGLQNLFVVPVVTEEDDAGFELLQLGYWCFSQRADPVLDQLRRSKRR